ncbi:MAG: AmmeMemoRadiSam system protein B [Candidatus Omnitrophica bacterium]|nr:AmmeMemoRadiSam system protein B [Candidatus Omnitrophota bacterium]
MKKIRKPSVRGYFYPGTKTELVEDLKKYIVYEERKFVPKAVICPHAGYVYSGKTAGKVYGKIVPVETAIILGPNHHGYGEPYAIDDSDEWETPCGNVEIDGEIRENLLEKSRYLQADSTAHRPEHSIEVQIPFLQFLNPTVKIVPVLISSMYDVNPWYEIGNAIALAISEIKRSVLVVASSDFTHYEPTKQAEKKDRIAIEKIVKLDADEFLNAVSEYGISICGFAPITSAITASKILGAREGILVDYTNSGSVSGDFEQVVGYAGIMLL